MKVLRFDESDEKKILNLLKKYKAIPFSEYSSSDELANIFLKNKIQKNKHDLWILEDNNEYQALMNICFSKWDSDHFKLKVGKIDFVISNSSVATKVLLNLLNDELSKYDLIMTTLRTDDPSLTALMDENFMIMSNDVTYSHNYKNTLPSFTKNSDIVIRLAKDDDIKNTAEIAKEAFTEFRMGKDHFHADSRIPKEKSDELYEKWANDLGHDDKIANFIAKIENEIVGFANGEINNDAEEIDCAIGTFPLGAVSSKFSGRGVYSALFRYVLEWFDGKVNYFEISTWKENEIVQKVWAKNNLRLIRSEYKLHRHSN